MKYMIYRTSDSIESDKKPCKDAYRGEVVHTDERHFKTPEEYDKYFSGPEWDMFEDSRRHWYSEGTNHRIENGWIVRDLYTDKCWYIDINTLEDLQKLTDEVGQVIFGDTNVVNRSVPYIEIYDEFRE